MASIAKALQVPEVLGGSNRLTLVEVGKSGRLTKNRVFRLLRTLAAFGHKVKAELEEVPRKGYPPTASR
jgi:hypothetical protein